MLRYSHRLLESLLKAEFRSSNLIVMKYLILVSAVLMAPLLSYGCSMYKITEDGKTIVGNNEDWISPNSKFWFEKGKNGRYDVMYMGQLNEFAQGALNSAGLVFDGFANDYLAVDNAQGKLSIPIGDAVRNIMQSMSTATEIRDYLETIDLSFLVMGMIVFVDKNGDYLIVEGEELILGSETEQCFSNFYYSQIESTDQVDLPNFKNGMKYISENTGNTSLDYTSDVMKSMMSTEDMTQYTTVYDLDNLTVRVYLFHDYSNFIEFKLGEKIQEGDHHVMIADLFPKDSPGYINYQRYNDPKDPTWFLKDLIGDESVTEEEMEEMGFAWIVNTVGYEWLKDKNNSEGAVEIFRFGTELMPNNANLCDSLGEAYLANEEFEKSAIAYRRSLELDGDNPNAKQALKNLEKKK